MIILVLGMVLIIIGALSIQFRELCNALKKSDETQWKQLGSPEGFFSYRFRENNKRLQLGIKLWLRNIKKHRDPENRQKST